MIKKYGDIYCIKIEVKCKIKFFDKVKSKQRILRLRIIMYIIE